MAQDWRFIVSRIVSGAVSGPYKPTPGVYNAVNGDLPDKDKGLQEVFYTFGDTFYSHTNQITTEVTNENMSLDDPGNTDITKQRTLVIEGLNPKSLSDSGHTPDFASHAPLGRSNPFYTYTGNKGRTVKVTFELHRDMFMQYTKQIRERYKNLLEMTRSKQEQERNMKNKAQDIQTLRDQLEKQEQISSADYMRLALMEDDLNSLYNNYVIGNSESRKLFFQNEEISKAILKNFRQTLDWFRSLNYPLYTENAIIAPQASLRIGNVISIKGVPSVDISYGDFYSNQFPVRADVTLTVMETHNPWSMDQIQQGEDRGYVEWTSKQDKS